MKTRMMKFGVGMIVAVAALALTATAAVASDDYRVHEWGTFTVVPDERGVPMSWYVHSGPAELPDFVYPKKKGLALPGKNIYSAVRMETPVLYFYTDKPRTVSVEVDFPGGSISEWYPFGGQVRHVDADGKTRRLGPFRWPSVYLNPERKTTLTKPTDGKNHYFEARGVDSVPVRVQRADQKWEEEEFLFYRGIRMRAFPALKAMATEDAVILAGEGEHQPRAALVFQRLDDGSMRWQTFKVDKGFVQVRRSDLPPRDELPLAELRQWILDEDLTEKEADAMLATWQKDWFEPGLRVFYLVPRPLVEELLPLTIHPQPDAVARAFVTRMDLLTPQKLDKMEKAVAAAADGKEAFAIVEKEFGRLAIAALRCIRLRQQNNKGFQKKVGGAMSVPLMRLYAQTTKDKTEKWLDFLAIGSQ